MPISKNYGIKRPQAFQEKVKAGQKRRAEQGLTVGRPRVAVTHRFFCELCGAKTEDKRGNTKRIACSQYHANLLNQMKRRKLPDDETVAVFYRDGMTTVEISNAFSVDRKAVRKALERAGCPRRRSGWRAVELCKESGCFEPVYKVWHAVHQKMHGTRCQKHFQEKRKRYSKNRWQKIKQLNSK